MSDGNTPILEDAAMRALGFTDHRPDHWYLCKRVGSYETLNITIDKATGDYDELVMDENFGQPAYYGNMVEPYRSQYRDAVDEHLETLNAAGLTVTVDHRLYGKWEESA